MKVTFITSSMNLGGAERQLLLLCNELNTDLDIEIITLDADGPLLEKYRVFFPGIKIVNSSQHVSPIVVLMLRRILLEKRPDVVITWLYKADILGGLASRLAANTPVIWSARNSSIPNLGVAKRELLKLLSRLIPKIVVANGLPALVFHESMGYKGKKLRRIPNLLSPWTQSTQSQSRLLGEITAETNLRVGIASRQVPGKGILETIQSVVESRSKTNAIELRIIGQETGISKKWRDSNLYQGHEVQQISTDDELSQWFSELDLYLMPSTMWESQPNSLIEAISIGCPILVSDTIELEIEIPPGLKVSILEKDWLIGALGRISELSPEERRSSADILRQKVYNLFEASNVRRLWLQTISEAVR